MDAIIEIEEKTTTKDTNILLEKIFIMLEDNQKCSSLYKDELEKKFLNFFLNFLERTYENKNDTSLSTEFKYEDMLDDLETLVDYLNVSDYKPSVNDDYNKALHNPIGKKLTENIALDMKIAECKSSGFKTESIVLKASNVIVYKYMKKENK